MNITVKKIRKLNPWITTNEQAKKIIKDYHSKPKVSLNTIITEAQRVKTDGRY